MRRSERARLRDLGPWLAALCLAVLVALVAPATSSAFTASITNSVNGAASKTRFVCADEFAGRARRSQAFFEYAMDERGDATTAVDSSDAGNSGTYEGSNAKDVDQPVACPGDDGGAYRLDGSTSRITTRMQFPPITGGFSEEIWFRTTGIGKLMGFESTTGDTSDHYDKHLYIGASGHLVFGIYNGNVQTLTSPDPVNDGAWHQAVATTSSDGSVLYLDGRPIASNTSYTTAENFAGYWRIGQGRLDGWPDQPSSSNWITGSLRFAAAYSFVLTAREVAAEASIGAPGARPAASASASPAPSAAATAAPAASDSAASTPSSPAASASTARQVPATSGTGAQASP